MKLGCNQSNSASLLEVYLTSIPVGASYIKEAAAINTPILIAIIVSCVVFLLFAGLLVMFCRCKRKQHKKGSGKDYEMEST
jgi:echinoid protein